MRFPLFAAAMDAGSRSRARFTLTRPLATVIFALAAALGVSCATSHVPEDPSSDPSSLSEIDAEQPGDMSAVPPVNPPPRVESGMHSDPPNGLNGPAAGLGYDLSFLLGIASALTGVVLLLLVYRRVSSKRQASRPSPGRRIALLTAFFALLTLVGCACAFREKFLELWYIHKLHSEDAGARRQAIERLADLPSRKAIPSLIDIVKLDPGLWLEGALAVVRVSSQETAQLVEAMEAKDLDCRRRLINALPELSGKAPGAAPLLLEIALRDPDDRTGILACDQLQAFGKDVVPGLVRALRDADNEDSLPDLETLPFAPPPMAPERGAERVLHALEVIGPAAAPAIPMLVRIIKARNGHSQRAVWAMARIGAPALPALIELLDHEDGWIRFEVVEAIRVIGPLAKEAVPKLIALLDHPDFVVRVTAVEALERMGPGAREAIPALICALGERGFGRRRRDSPRFTRGPACDARTDMAAALGTLGEKSDAAVTALLEALHADTWCLRIAAAEALGQMGPSAEAAIPELVSASHAHALWGTSDRNCWASVEELRGAAARSLEKIRSQRPDPQPAPCRVDNVLHQQVKQK